MRRLPTAPNYRRMLREASRNPAPAPPPRPPPNRSAAGSGLLGASQLSLRTECAYPPPPNPPSPYQRAAGSGLLGVSQLSLRTECAYEPPCAPTSPPPNTHPSEQAAEGSGLLSALHLSLRKECACQTLPPNTPLAPSREPPPQSSPLPTSPPPPFRIPYVQFPIPHSASLIPGLTAIPHRDMIPQTSGFRRPVRQISIGIHCHNNTVLQRNKHMGREYKILCKPTKGAALHQLLHKLPPPFHRPQMLELYNYRVDNDGYYLVDHLIDRSVAATALQVFLDAALSSSDSVTIIEP